MEADADARARVTYLGDLPCDASCHPRRPTGLQVLGQRAGVAAKSGAPELSSQHAGGEPRQTQATARRGDASQSKDVLNAEPEIYDATAAG